MVMGVVFITTHAGSCLGCSKPIKTSTRPKFDMWSSNSRISIINDIRLWFDISDTHRKLFCYQKHIKGPIRLEFGM